MAITESRIQAIENDIAQLVQKVDYNMVTKTDWRAYNLTMESALQDLQDSVTSLESQMTTLQDAYLAHTDHPPPIE